jgi:hypothetical protein
MFPQEFQLWTRKDSEGTANERATRSWFYFGVSGQSEGDFIVLNLLNLNKQTRLYSQDYRPWFWHQGQQDWQPIRWVCNADLKGCHWVHKVIY